MGEGAGSELCGACVPSLEVAFPRQHEGEELGADRCIGQIFPIPSEAEGNGAFSGGGLGIDFNRYLEVSPTRCHVGGLSRLSVSGVSGRLANIVKVILACELCAVCYQANAANSNVINRMPAGLTQYL